MGEGAANIAGYPFLRTGVCRRTGLVYSGRPPTGSSPVILLHCRGCRLAKNAAVRGLRNSYFRRNYEIGRLSGRVSSGKVVAELSHFPYVPHLTDLIDKRAREVGEEMSWSDFMAWDAPWLRVCDALLFLAESRGANIELEEAKRLGKIIFYSSGDVPRLERQVHHLPESSVV